MPKRRKCSLSREKVMYEVEPGQIGMLGTELQIGHAREAKRYIPKFDNAYTS